ncbi:related to SWR1 - DEAH-box protein, putative RNA helicase [Cephalotrichum gorgonifer]|uniref:DNA helicase n=1 Tax=Cephalotrichum gorgonifer TaxID=2041049 RepID=A0AAE8MNV3_9PEZI|nr:related to SWR1 - DEAH-box protein, putative RNA helicase [Cephalotrichum gorgonifer]
MIPSASPRPTTRDVGLACLDDLDNDSPLSDLGDIAFDSDFDSDLDPSKPVSDVNLHKQRDSATAIAPLTSGGHAKENGLIGSLENSDQYTATPNTETDDTGRPTKRRRIRDTTPESSPAKKPESPPWKKIEADGPSTIIDNGRRKSGRLATTPLAERPNGDNRRTRGVPVGTPSSLRSSAANGHPIPTSQPASQRPSHKLPKKNELKLPRTSTKQSQPENVKPSSRAGARRRSSPPPQPARHSTRTRVSRFTADDGIVDAPDTPGGRRAGGQPRGAGRGTRIRLRTRLDAIPIINPDQFSKRPRLYPSFDEYWRGAWEIPVEEGGLYSADDDARITDDAARNEAETIQKIEAEVEEGGLLSQERCSLFVPDRQDEPPKQWSHMDHVTKAAANFRRLLVGEHIRHKLMAKKLAESCREEWIRRQPKSAEQLELEARNLWLARYRLVVRAMFGTWENVKTEINRRRLEAWEVQEQRRVKAALNEAVNLSEQKLQARKAHFDSDLSDEELDLDLDELGSDILDDITNEGGSEGDEDDADGSDDEGDDEGDDDDNMSSSSEEEDAEVSLDIADENLTHEQLLAKYANLPDLPPGSQSKAPEESGGTKGADATNDGDTSDESIDMDDDLGSTDMDSGSDDGETNDDDEEEEEESDDDAPDGLLGLFFGKSELEKLQAEAEPPAEGVSQALETESGGSGSAVEQGDGEPKANGVKPADQDDATNATDENDGVSLIRYPSSRCETTELESSAATPHARSDQVDDVTGSVPNGIAGSPSVELKSTQVPNGIMKSSSLNMTGSNEPTVPDLPTPADANADADVVMQDVSLAEPTEKPLSPETDVDTNPQSPGRSQSPRTSDTKPSDLDTASTSGLVPAKRSMSRSGSPPPPGPKTEIPFLLRGTLREYQHYGLDWLAGLYANNTNGILADEMGLGKTIQTIALLAHLACHHEVWGPHLIIVPTSVMLNWEMEFKKWCPGFKILSYYGSQEERKRKRHGWNNDDVWNVCITSYQLVLQDQQVFKRRRWHYMILDEAHNIKNFKSQRWQSLLGFNTHSRLLLTGTPLQNNLTELWSLLFFLMPSENGVGGFADLQEFHDWFHKPETQILESGKETMDDEARAIISKLHKVLRPYLLRRLKADVEKQMPAKYEHVELCRLSKRQRELYDGFLARSDTRSTLASGNYLSIINCLMQLRKVCNHPDLFIDRPIMTSFPMETSVAGAYEYTERFVQRSILAKNPMDSVSLGFLNLIPTMYESISTYTADTIYRLTAPRVLIDLREIQKSRAQDGFKKLDPTTVKSNIAYIEAIGRWDRFEELQHCVYLNALRRQRRPIYGDNLVKRLTLDLHASPRKMRSRVPRKVLNWFEEDSVFIKSMVKDVDRRSAELRTTIEKFACITPAVIAKDLHTLVLGAQRVNAFQNTDLQLSKTTRWAPFMPKETPPDPWHESRMRLSVQFPDKRLLQYDCGKLQTLDRLLRKLQAGGHRALIFTQMTKVLDILEQFLNIHGHKYLRLDGATKVEQRQILTDRFNNDPRILCFILSTRSGGLGINLTGADTVIFYDQDWNPAMDKQCQDRCHRIGQTRDVHIYRLVSEHTIEANILRKASQKQMLDDVVIQEGEFTTDHFTKRLESAADVMAAAGPAEAVSDGVAAANAAMDRVLGGVETDRSAGAAFAQAEDTEDVTAAKVAQGEMEADEVDFSERGPASGMSTGGQNTPRTETTVGGEAVEAVAAVEEVEVERSADGAVIQNVDSYMLGFMGWWLEGTPLVLPVDKKKKKKRGKDTRKR